MGLDVSHDCWGGAYSSFHRFRAGIARAVGIPDLMGMQGFGGEGSWDELAGDPLVLLLTHSDCEGVIECRDCLPLARRLEEVAEKVGGVDLKRAILRFAAGLRAAAAAKEDVVFS